MAFVKKFWFLGIFISILSIFAMSYNVSALTPVLDLNNYDTIIRGGIYNNECTFTGGSNIVSGSTTSCAVTVTTSATRLNSITTVGTFDVKQGDILNFFLIISSANNNYFIAPPVWTQFGGGIGWDVIGFQEVSKDDYIYKTLGTNTLNPNGIDTTILNGVSRIYEFTMRANQAGNLKLGLSSSSGILSLSTIDNSMRVSFSARNFSIYRYAGSEENKEQEQKTQEAVDDSQAAGSGSSSSASQGGANLLSAITGFFNVITSAQPSNCRFNAPLNTYFGNERLNVDLCALDLPSGIGALTSIIAIGILIPFAIHMFNKFIALFRSFQS